MNETIHALPIARSGSTRLKSLTERQEKFAALVASGTPAAEAYRQAYHRPDLSPQSSATEAYRLKSKLHVADRIATLS